MNTNTQTREAQHVDCTTVRCQNDKLFCELQLNLNTKRKVSRTLSPRGPQYKVI